MFSTVFLALTSAAYGQDLAMSGYEGALTNFRQTQDALNSRIVSNSTEDVLSTYVSGSTAQIESAISAVTNASAPYSGDIAVAVNNYLLSDFYNSVTSGAEKLAGQDLSADLAAQIVDDYTRLIKIGQASNISTSQLEQLSAQISPSTAASKRSFSFGWEFFVSGSIQFQNSMCNSIQNTTNYNPDQFFSLILTFIQAIDAQCQHVVDFCSNLFQQFTSGLIQIIAGIVLKPIYLAIVICAKALCAKIAALTLTLDVFNALQSLIATYVKVCNIGSSCGIDVSDLQSCIDQLKQIPCQQ